MFTAMFLDHYSKLDKAKKAAEAAEVVYVKELLEDFGLSIKTIRSYSNIQIYMESKLFQYILKIIFLLLYKKFLLILKLTHLFLHLFVFLNIL